MLAQPDYLHPILSESDLTRMSTLALANIGHGVFELLTRGELITHGTLTAAGLHKKTTSLVCACAQAQAAKTLLPHLTEAEETIFRHGRNAKPKTVPKSSTLAEYAYATALEALFGWLFLKQEYARLNALYHIIVTSRPSAV